MAIKVESSIVTRLRNSRLFRDSFWAVFGNGMGYAILLLAGILIARFLGRDVYGEYGLVKTSMLYVAGFATMGLGVTSTKYVAESVKRNSANVKAIIRDALFVTTVFSSIIAVALIVTADRLAVYLDVPTLVNAFRALGVLVILKAIATTQAGVLAGLGEFRVIARNNVLSGLVMLVISVPLTLLYSLTGALVSLLLSQVSVVILNVLAINKFTSFFPTVAGVSRKKELFLFSIPIALQESSYTLCAWGGTLMLAKMSSIGEVGVYTAAAQWNAVITFIPGLLSNVILSHLASSGDDDCAHRRMIGKMAGINLFCTVIPFVVIYVLAGWITDFYGDSFEGLKTVLRIITFATIFTCTANVFYSEFIARGYNWNVFFLRIVQDFVTLGLGYVLLFNFNGIDGAAYYAWAYVCGSVIYILLLILFYFVRIRRQS